MLWVLLDVVIALLAVVILVAVALSLWRRVKAFTREAGEAGEVVGKASDTLAAAQAAQPARR
ncbi:MAG: hypothetical protein M3P04_07580 [Actinomycetota bacterium]|nr:hypothetical protein [Actinomycetota bacterium]